MGILATAAKEALWIDVELLRALVSGEKEEAIKSRHGFNHGGKLPSRKAGSLLSNKDHPLKLSNGSLIFTLPSYSLKREIRFS